MSSAESGTSPHVEMATNGTAKPLWAQVLDEQLERFPDSIPLNLDFGHILNSMIRDYLFCDEFDAAATFARRFDDLYATVYEPRFNGYNGKHKGWTGYLIAFYESWFRLTKTMRYDDPTQNKVIQLFVELGKVPPHHARIFIQSKFEWVDAEIWVRNPLLAHEHKDVELSAPWAGGYNFDDPYHVEEFESHMKGWVDVSAFRARCTAARVDEGDKDRFTTAADVIATGLEAAYLGEEILDCHIMAAAQYILLAGGVIDAECVKRQLMIVPERIPHSWTDWADGKGPEVWKRWGNRLAEIADALESGGELGFKLYEHNREALTDMVVRARDKMRALEPELFAESGPQASNSGGN